VIKLDVVSEGMKQVIHHCSQPCNFRGFKKLANLSGFEYVYVKFRVCCKNVVDHGSELKFSLVLLPGFQKGRDIKAS
jgi:hypothetical protein